MDTAAFIRYLKEQPDYQDQIVHIEHILPRAATYGDLENRFLPDSKLVWKITICSPFIPPGHCIKPYTPR